jgi:hypothetical protein
VSSPVGTSIDQTSPGLRAEFRLKAMSREFSCQIAPETVPGGSAGVGRRRSVDAVAVHHERHRVPVRRERELFDIGALRAEEAQLAVAQRQQRRATKLAAGIGRQEDVTSVRREREVVARHARAGARLRKYLRELAGLHVHHVNTRVLDRLELHQRDLAIVEREREIAPSGSGQRRERARALRLQRVEQGERLPAAPRGGRSCRAVPRRPARGAVRDRAHPARCARWRR